MKGTVQYLFYSITTLLLLFSMATTVWGNDGDVLNRKIQLSKNKGTVYQLLKEVSDKSGYLFIYDSQVVDNDKTVKIRKKEYTLRDAIYAITNNDHLNIKIVGNHILLNQQQEPDIVVAPVIKARAEEKDSIRYLTLGGTLIDGISGEPIAYGAVGILNSSIGTISNQGGDFRLVVPDSLINSKLKLSHIGYQSQEVELSFLTQQHIVFTLSPKIIPLQEVVVRIVNPAEVLRNMWLKRSENYSNTPVHITAFYREGIDHKNKNLSLTEAVLEIYKTGYQSGDKSDQVKLLKMRRIVDIQRADTLLTKMKSGISSALLLDLVKGDTPGFLDPLKNSSYVYRHSDITVLDGRTVNVIAFEQNQGDDEPLYRGDLYIDAENNALVQANFEVHPDHIKKATDILIVRKSPQINITADKVTYVVSYKPINGIYYISHIRGDLHFKVRKKNRLFSSPLHMWFEMVNCETDTSDDSRFARNERLATNNIFSDTSFEYDSDFWGHFNVIMQEDKLKESVLQILKKNK